MKKNARLLERLAKAQAKVKALESDLSKQTLRSLAGVMHIAAPAGHYVFLNKCGNYEECTYSGHTYPMHPDSYIVVCTRFSQDDPFTVRTVIELGKLIPI